MSIEDMKCYTPHRPDKTLSPAFIDLLNNGDSNMYFYPKERYNSPMNKGERMFFDNYPFDNLGAFSLDVDGFVAGMCMFGGLNDLKPTHLIVPPELEFMGAMILENKKQPIGSGLQGVFSLIMELIADPYLTDENDWFLIHDPGLIVSSTLQPGEWQKLNPRYFMKVIA